MPHYKGQTDIPFIIKANESSVRSYHPGFRPNNLVLVHKQHLPLRRERPSESPVHNLRANLNPPLKHRPLLTFLRPTLPIDELHGRPLQRQAHRHLLHGLGHEPRHHEPTAPANLREWLSRNLHEPETVCEIVASAIAGGY